MFGVGVQSLFGSDDIDTPAGRAIIDARYSTLRRQVPIICLLVSVNIAGYASIGYLKELHFDQIKLMAAL